MGKRRYAALAAWFVAAGPAFAGRPLQTEDADVLEPASCEVEGGNLHLTAFDEHRRDMSLQLACGLGASTQLGVAGSHSSGDNRIRALQLAGKTAVWKGQDDAALTLAYAWAAGEIDGSSARHSFTEVLAVYSIPLAAGTAHANLGWLHDALASQHSARWGLAYEHEPIGRIAPMAEVFAERGAPWWSLALRVTVVEKRLFADAAYARRMDPRRPTLWTLGFRLAF